MRRREAIAGILAAVGGTTIGCGKVSSDGSTTAAGSGQPTLDDIRQDAQALGFELSDAELKAVHSYAPTFLKSLDRVTKAAPPPAPLKYGPRESARPSA
jgi:hypothetical protein